MASPELPDMYDDDYWKGLDGRLNRDFAEHLNGWMGRLEALSERLKEEAHLTKDEPEGGRWRKVGMINTGKKYREIQCRAL